MTPANSTYSGAAGATLYCGRSAPVGLPAWAAASVLNAWMEIPGTSGADGSAIDAYSGLTVKQSTGEVLIALAGGHGDSFDTRVSAINLLVGAPAWRNPRPKNGIDSSLAATNQPYTLDGVTPSSRHTRYSCIYCPPKDRIMFIGTTGVYGTGGVQFVDSNGFSMVTNTWDAPGTWAPSSTTSGTGIGIDDLGNIWTRTQKWLHASNTFLPLPSTWSSQPIAFDSLRRQMFGIQYGDNQGSSVFLGHAAKTISENLESTRVITFNASAAWTEFQTIPFAYIAIEYVASKDKFYLYDGATSRGGPGVVWAISPNDGTVWDIAKLDTTGTVTPTNTAGIQSKFAYVEALKGFVILPLKTSPMYFLRIA
jgi:hypothetical protein